MTTKEEDFVNDVFVVNTLTPLLFFFQVGIVYKLKTYKIPQGSPTSKGKGPCQLTSTSVWRKNNNNNALQFNR